MAGDTLLKSAVLKRGNIWMPKPIMLERAEELAKRGGYVYLYQIERVLIQEGYGSSDFGADDRARLRAILKSASQTKP